MAPRGPSADAEIGRVRVAEAALRLSGEAGSGDCCSADVSPAPMVRVSALKAEAAAQGRNV